MYYRRMSSADLTRRLKSYIQIEQTSTEKNGILTASEILDLK